MSKLDPKSLKCIFLGYSWVQKGYRCYCPSLHKYLVSVDVTFLENVPLSLPPIHTSQGEEDNLLVYTLASPIVSLELASIPTKVKPPITQVYARRQHPPKSRALHLLLRHLIQFSVMIFILLFVKVNVSELIQFPHFVLMTVRHHILVLLLHPWTLFRCLSRFLKPSITLVGEVL